MPKPNWSRPRAPVPTPKLSAGGCILQCIARHVTYREVFDVFRDPRVTFGEFLLTRMVAGAKGVRYIASSQYRERVQAYWRNHPTSRARHIRMMVCGALLDTVILSILVTFFAHK
jgi:hypothetical protein